MIVNQQHSNEMENEFRNIKLKLKGTDRHSELQAVKALMTMSAQHYVPQSKETKHTDSDSDSCDDDNNGKTIINSRNNLEKNPNFSRKNNGSEPIDLSCSQSPEPIYGLSITMTEEEFKELAEKDGIKNVIGDPVCKLCGGLFSGPLGIALHMCPAMKRQVYRCDICGEDKWKTKANLHSHIKWCKRRLVMKTTQS